MKKIISLIISVSLFLQIVGPTAKLVTYAQTGNSQGQKKLPYKLEWDPAGSLDESLKYNEVTLKNGEALLTWDIGESQQGTYILEYFLENERDSTKPAEKVRFEFERDNEEPKKANVTLKMLNSKDEIIEKTYRRYDFNNINAGKWETPEEDSITLELTQGSPFPGGRISVGAGGMDIRFRWGTNNRLYFQSNSIKDGNITPFILSHDILEKDRQDRVEVLAGIEGYKISPTHIEIDENNKMIDRGKLEQPGDKAPGSEPGIKIEFQRPRSLVEEDEDYIFKEISLEDSEKIKADFTISKQTDAENSQAGDSDVSQFSFYLGDEGTIEGKNKKVIFKDGIYNIYMSQDDKNHPNIMKMESLQESMIFDGITLDLSSDPSEDASDERGYMGTFTPEERGRTYLWYQVERTSAQEAYIKIKPFKERIGTSVEYTLRTSPNDIEPRMMRKLFTREYTREEGDEEEYFTIPIPISPGDTGHYFYIQVGGKDGYSQKLHYKPREDEKNTPPTPTIESIHSIYAVPSHDVGGQPETIGFDLIWSAPKNQQDATVLDNLLEDGDLYYELSIHDEKEVPENKAQLIKVFKVSKTIEGIRVTPYAGTAGKQPGEENSANIRYDSANNTFTMENIVLKNLGLDNWEQIKLVDYGDNPNKYPEADKIIVDNEMKEKKSPGIFYLTMQAKHETTGAGIVLSKHSNPKSITISTLEEVIPVSTNIESSQLPSEADPDNIKHAFSWENVDLTKYIKQMLDPLRLSLGEEHTRTYEIYLSQEEGIKDKVEADIEEASSSYSAVVDNLTRPYKVKKEEIETLRQGDYIRLDYTSANNGGMNMMTLEGLDPNQVYYSAIRVRLDIKDKNEDKQKSKYSIFSQEHNFTTYIKPGDPSPGERVPPVPEELAIVDQPNNTTVTIDWKAPKDNKNGIFSYEVVRFGTSMSNAQQNNRLISLEDLINDNKDKELESWELEDLELEDDSLKPNKTYYYYVRTVLVEDGEKIYSSWVGLPVTTAPVQRPIDLKVETAEAYRHDPKREIVISFLAPIPKDASVPADYDFDIAIYGELDDDYRKPSTNGPTEEVDENIPTGYRRFVYKINNEKPGRRYDIKVAVIDHINNSQSLYSDGVTTRTHFDQEEQDRDDKLDEYIRYFEDRVEALRRKPYWALEDTSREFSVKYRSNYIIPEINSVKSYNLAVKEGVTDFTYYMPASVIASSNLRQTSLEINQGNVTYTIRPSMITTELIELKDTLEEIKEKNIQDYYVSFNFRQRVQSTNSMISGILTPEFIVDVELVTLKEDDLVLEDEMMAALNDEIIAEQKRFIEDLEKALKRGKILDEDLEAIVNHSIDYIEKNHQKDVRALIARNTRKTKTISQWNKSMLLMATIEGNASAQGYKLGWQDTALTTFNLALGYGMEIIESGIYVFKGQKITMPVIPGVGGANHLIAQYQLTDFFGINGNINPSNLAIKKDVLGAMARVLGAPRGADYNQYLKQTGIKGVNNIGMNLPMKKEEGIYLLMQVYEKNLKKPISSVYVKNRNIIPNIGEFSFVSQPYVLVAVDSKIISIGSGIKAKDAMEIKDVLQILTNIMAGLR